jgi:lysophospholipase L1-like esterase
VDPAIFPWSAAYFKDVNERLREIAVAEGAEFIDWASEIDKHDLFYRDGFHPNAAGASALAAILRQHISEPQKRTIGR